MSEFVTRSFRLDLIVPDEQRPAVLRSIDLYRHCCRQCYAALLTATAAGAIVTYKDDGVSLKPDGDRAKLLLALALDSAKFDKDDKVKGEGTPYRISIGSGLGYEMRQWFRQHLWPTAMSFVWDSARRDVVTVWNSGDPEFPRAKRGWLALQGARGVAQFRRRGIGFPVATARPKLDHHSLTLKWDHDLGEVVFRIPRMDGGRWAQWQALVNKSDGWSLGTIYLSEQDGKVYAAVSYSRPTTAAVTDPTRVLKVSFGESAENFLRITGPDGACTADLVSATSAVQQLARLMVQRKKREAAKAACGSPRQPWGNRKANRADTAKLERGTLNRLLVVKDWNHAFSRRIITRAVSWRCGVIEMGKFPETMFTHPWQWAQLTQYISYKASELGITVAQDTADTGLPSGPKPVQDDR